MMGAKDIAYLVRRMAETLTDFYGYEPCVTSGEPA